MTRFPSVLLQEAVDEFSRLPGIGRKTALRLVLHLLRQEKEDVVRFGEVFIRLIQDIKHCNECHNVSDTDTCHICADLSRDRETICVVESIKDVMSIENTHQYKGVYHVLGGIISPMDGIGPKDLSIDLLLQRIERSTVREIILALSATIEGDTTNFYIYRKLKDTPLKISTIARGIAVGDELEYADEITLGRSIINRLPFAATL